MIEKTCPNCSQNYESDEAGKSGIYAICPKCDHKYFALSHSRVDKYLTCPRSYRLHYIDDIRPTTTTSALFFGSAIGLVLNAICLRKKDDPTPEEIVEIADGQDPLQYLDKLLETVEINHVEEPLEKSSNIRYYRKDYNPSILTDEDLAEIAEYALELGLELGDRPAKFADFIEEYLSNQIHDTDILSFMNFQFYLSLRRKGRMIITEFLDNFFHKIIKVHSIEREIRIDMSLPTDPEYTDFMLGYIDMECSYQLCREFDKNALKPYIQNEKHIEKLNKQLEKLQVKLEKQLKKCKTGVEVVGQFPDQLGEDEINLRTEFKIEQKKILKEIEQLAGEMVDMFCPGDIIEMTTDFKTSANRYGSKKLTESSQLARYQFVAQNQYHGYIVFVKTLKTPKNGLRKGETHIDIQVMFENRDEELENTVLDKDEEILEKIEAGEFPKIDQKSCQRIYGARCQNYGLCWENSMRNLVDLSEKN